MRAILLLVSEKSSRSFSKSSSEANNWTDPIKFVKSLEN